MFKKDDYIVCLEGEFFASKVRMSKSECANKNYILKQSQDSHFLRVYKGWNASYEKVNDQFTFDKSKMLTDWRYATPEEIEEYERLGEPYDVTTLKSFKNEDTSYLIELFAKNNII